MVANNMAEDFCLSLEYTHRMVSYTTDLCECHSSEGGGDLFQCWEAFGG